MKQIHNLSATAKASLALLIGSLALPNGYAHTTSVGYENAGPGSVTFWYGTYHNSVNYTEGSLLVTNTHGYSSTVTFSSLVSTKPTGLIDGTTNFYSNGTALTGTPTTTINNWQGATFTSLSPDTYTFTYIPIGTPTSTWDPTDSIILSSSVTLSSVDLGGGQYAPISNRVSGGAATVLDSLSGSATGAMGDALSTLSGLSTEQQTAALRRIAPNTGRAIGAASAQTVSGALDTVQARLDGIRAHDFVVAWDDDWMNGNFQPTAAGNDASQQTDEPRKRSVWGKAFGSQGKQAAVDEFSGYHVDTYGISFGTDVQVREDWAVGAAFTYATTSVAMKDAHDGDGTDIKTYQLTGYTSRDFGRWYAEGMLSYAQQTYDGARDTTVSGIASSSFKGTQWAARATAGMPIKLNDKVTLTPTAGLEWNLIQQDGYTETGAGALSLEVGAPSANRFRSALGATLATTVPLDGGAELKPSMHLVWRHEFNNSGMDSTTTFTGGGASFVTPGQDLAKNTINLGGVLAWQKTKTFQLSLQLDGEKAPGYTAVSTQLVGHWRF